MQFSKLERRSMSAVLEEVAVKLEIPGGVERVVLLVNHSITPKNASDGIRLTQEGIQLCGKVAPFYQELVRSIQGFGQPSFHSSTAVKEANTARFVFGSVAYDTVPENDLKIWAAMGDINGGQWLADKQASGATEKQIVQAFFDERRTLYTAPFVDQYVRYATFVAGIGGGIPNQYSRFVVAFGREIGISLVAADHLSQSELGFGPCEGVAFFVTGRMIVGAEKIIPIKQ